MNIEIKSVAQFTAPTFSPVDFLVSALGGRNIPQEHRERPLPDAGFLWRRAGVAIPPAPTGPLLPSVWVPSTPVPRRTLIHFHHVALSEVNYLGCFCPESSGENLEPMFSLVMLDCLPEFAEKDLYY